MSCGSAGAAVGAGRRRALKRRTGRFSVIVSSRSINRRGGMEMGKNTQIPTNVRRDVNLRDQGRCVRCGMAGTEQHHRIRRRDGGHRRSNIVLLCHDCHRVVTLSPLTAKLTGYIVPPWREDGTLVTPLRTFTGRWVLLDDEGGVTYTEESVA